MKMYLVCMLLLSPLLWGIGPVTTTSTEIVIELHIDALLEATQDEELYLSAKLYFQAWYIDPIHKRVMPLPRYQTYMIALANPFRVYTKISWTAYYPEAQQHDLRIQFHAFIEFESAIEQNGIFEEIIHRGNLSTPTQWLIWYHDPILSYSYAR